MRTCGALFLSPRPRGPRVWRWELPLVVAETFAISLCGAAAGYNGRVLIMLSEQEKLQHDIHSLTEVIKRTWAEVASKPMRPKDRPELRGHIAGLVTELGRLLGLLE